MSDLTITLVQANQCWEDKEKNYSNYERLIGKIQTDVIVLPEMFNTGFSMNVKEMAEDWSNSDSLMWLLKMAKNLDAAFYTSLIIKDNSNYYNRGVFVEPTGKISTYDKRKLFSLAREEKFFEPGEGETIVYFRGWNFQLQICYDLRFPEIARNELLSSFNPKYDVILYVANWPQKRIGHWNSLLNARAIENQSYVIGVNRVGSDNNNLLYNGGSKIVDALGVETKFENNVEGTLSFVLKSTNLSKIRESIPFLKDL